MFVTSRVFFRWTVVVLLLVVYSFFSNGLVLASKEVYFEDDFNSSILDGNRWYSHNDGGFIEINDGYLKLSATSSMYFPVVTNKLPAIPPDGDYSIEIKFRWPNVTPWGTGIFLGNDLLFYSTPLGGVTNQFVIWPNLNDNNFQAITMHCLTNNMCDGVYTTLGSFPLSAVDHVVKLFYEAGNFQVFIDGQKIENIALQNSLRRSQYINFGNVVKLDSNLPWTSFWVDYVKIYRENVDLVSTSLKPVIVIPGLGASWDVGAILGGTAGTNWEVPSFVNLYDNLINSLVNAGYVKDENLFVFAYDWRKSLNDLSGDLANYIADLISLGKIKPDEKIDFIGHSYGGLVARTYGQKVGTEKIDKIITAGSPHQGILDAYATWEGATVWKNIWWQKAALELQTQLNQRAGENRVETVRRLSPGIKDVLPTFDFLKRDGVLILSSSLIQKNSTLPELNASLAAIDALTNVNGGGGKTTDRFVRVVQRGWLDRTLGLWEDGKPIADNPFETTTEGDDSVPLISSLGSFSSKTTANTDHGGIVNDTTSIGNIFDQLGLDKTKILTNVTPDQRKSVFIATLRSPGRISVCNTANICDENLGIYLTDEKIFFLPGYNNEDLNVRVVGQGDIGSYRLHLGDLVDDSARWETVSGNLKSGDQIDLYDFSATEEEITIVGQGGVTQRSLEEQYSQLDSLWPRWDKKNLFTIAQSGAKNKKIVAIRQLRELLSTLAIKAYKEGRLDRVEAILAFWKELDKYAESVIGTGNSTKVSVLNANIRLVDGYKALAENLLRNSNSLPAGKFYLLFTERFDEAKAIRDINRDLSLDKTLSGRYLLQTALGVR